MDRQTTIYAGHYGSGKTNLAVNHALRLRAAGREVSVLDLAIVNPYFRTADSAKLFKEHGIGFIASEFANTNLDIPSIPAQAGGAFADDSRHIIADLGGDDAGATALGRFSDVIRPDQTDMLMVLNRCRPMTRTVAQALEMRDAIEYTSKFRFTGIVNNTNLGKDTDERLVLDGIRFAKEVSEAAGLPILYTAVLSRLYDNLEGKIENLIPIDIFVDSGKFNL